MKEFFSVLILFGFASCTSVSAPKPVQKAVAENSYELGFERTEEVIDTLSEQNFPMRSLQQELDALSGFTSPEELVEQLNSIALKIQELEARSEPEVWTNRGLKSRLKLLRTYLLQLKGALEENDSVKGALSEVNQTNQALIAYWNAMSDL